MIIDLLSMLIDLNGKILTAFLKNVYQVALMLSGMGPASVDVFRMVRQLFNSAFASALVNLIILTKMAVTCCILGRREPVGKSGNQKSW